MQYRFQDNMGLFAQPSTGPQIDFDQILAIVRRQWKVAASCAAVTLVCGIAYIFTAVPTYTASGSLLIDTDNQKLHDQLMNAVTSVLDDETSILSQVELLKSEKIALAVSEKLDLKNDQDFKADQESLIHNLLSSVKSAVRISGLFGSEAPPADDEAVQQQIVQTLDKNLDVERVGRTYVLSLDYSSKSPKLAQRITQAFADAYLADQLDSKFDATRRATDWLQQRISELRQKSLETDLAVQKFKAEKGLITTAGELVSDQQLAQINSQLILAQAETASSQARYNRIKSIIDSQQMEAAVTESLKSDVIIELRKKYLEASRKEADIASRLGENHVQAVRLRGEMSEYSRLMFQELGRIAQSYHSDYEVALARQNSLQQQVTKATNVTANANDSQVQLRELSREAETYKNLYETFLQRYQETVQQQSFPVTEARVISRPALPSVATSPKKLIVLALSIVAGLGIGTALGAFREFRDRFFRTGDQIRDVLELEPIGSVPLAKPGKALSQPGGVVDPRAVAKGNSVANYVIEHPLSAFAEAMRSAKIAVDVQVDHKRPKIVGFVSTLPGEGKSTISINFAELLANQGSRVLLIDADLRNPGATRQIARHAERGILEALQDSMSVRDILMINPDTKLAFLPAVIKRRIPYSSDLLASDAMDRIIHEVSEAFDYIIFDLPPLAPVVDARALSSKLDTFIFVVEWGKTARNAIKKTLQSNASVAQKCAGVILNKVDTEKMKYYQAHGSSEFYYSRYSSYYRE